MAKRTNVTINGKDYYRTRLKVGEKPNGKPEYKVFYGKNKTEALKLKAEYKEGLSSSIDLNKVTFHDLFHQWLFEVKRAGISANTFTKNESLYRNHVQNMLFIQQRIIDVRSLDIQKDFNKIKSASIAKEVRILLNSFCIYAVNEKYRADNPMRGVLLPKYVPPAKKLFLEKSEFEHLVNSMKSDFTLFKYVFDAFLGLRIGELAALQINDVDLEKLNVHISKSISRIPIEVNGERKRVVQVGPTKNRKDRDVPLPSNLLPYVKRQIELVKAKHRDLGIKYTPNALLFPRFDLSHLDKSNANVTWLSVQKRLGIEPVSFHKLRHTFAVMHIELGTHLKTIAELMGHSNTKMLEEIYAHISDETKEKAMNKLNSYTNL